MTGLPSSGGTRAEASGRVPPQDLDAEMALLGSMMMSRDVVGDIVQIIGKSDSAWFYRPDHQRLFEALVDLYDEGGKPIDLVIVADHLRRLGLLEAVGGIDYLVQLAESFADVANAEHYARVVRDKGMLRDLIRVSHEIADMCYTQGDETSAILDVAEQRMGGVTERRVSGSAQHIGVMLGALARQIELRHDAELTGLPTGLVQLDEYTSGFQPGDLIIIAGRPSMGKTALGLTIAHNMAHEDGRPVAFFSMEMSASQVAHRVLCAQARFDSHRLRRRMLSDEDVHRLLSTCAEMESAPLYVDDTPGMTALELRAKARRLRQRFGIQAVFVDYLQLMHAPRAESRQVEISTISRQLKSLGRELNIPVIAMAQLNRAAEQREGHRPRMSDLRESGAIEQDADVVLLIHREEYYRPDDESIRGQAELVIAKQRNGPTATVELSFLRSQTWFANLYRGPEPAFASRTEDAPF